MGLERNGDAFLVQGQESALVLPSLGQGDFLVMGSALAYTFHCIRLEKYAKATRAVTLAACKATTETILSVLLVVGLLAYSTNESVGSGEKSANVLADLASESGAEIASFLKTMSHSIPEGSIPQSVTIPAIGAVLWTGLVTCGYTSKSIYLVCSLQVFNCCF